MRTFSATASQGSFGQLPSPPVNAASDAPPGNPNAGANALPTAPATFSTSQGGDVATSPELTEKKCATVTMMLAKRIIRNAWSVEDEHFFEPNHMNVWQTLEFLSSITLRKRYNYEGYNDTNNNSALALTPSWRRDSFVEKNVSPNVDESTSTKNSAAAASSSSTGGGRYAVASGNVNASAPHVGNGGGSGTVRLGSAGVASGGGAGAAGDKSRKGKHPKKTIPNNGERRIKAINVRGRDKRRGKQKLHLKELDTEYALSPSDYADLIKCT